MTAVAGSTFTAAQFNLYVRDNLNETAPAKATSAGQFFVSTAANAIAARQLVGAVVATSQTTTTTSYTNLATVGPTVTCATSNRAVVFFASEISNSGTAGASSVSVDVTGATTIGASNAWRAVQDGVAASNVNRVGVAHLFTSLNAGNNTFTMKYLAGSGTATFGNREIIVLPF